MHILFFSQFIHVGHEKFDIFQKPNYAVGEII